MRPFKLRRQYVLTASRVKCVSNYHNSDVKHTLVIFINRFF